MDIDIVADRYVMWKAIQIQRLMKTDGERKHNDGRKECRYYILQVIEHKGYSLKKAEKSTNVMCLLWP